MELEGFMRFALNILISLALIPATAPAAQPSPHDHAYRAAAYYYYTSPTLGDFVRNLPLKDEAAKAKLAELAAKSGASRVKPHLLEWNPKTRTAKITIDRKTATVAFDPNNSGYFKLNGKRVKLESGAAIEKTWNDVQSVLKPGRTNALMQFLLPEANAQGIGILEGILLAAAITTVVLGVAAFMNQDFFQPLFCTKSVDPRKCLRKISETVRALTTDAVPKVTITGFQCKDKNLAHASFVRDPNVNLVYDGEYNEDRIQYFTPPALFAMPVEIPVSGGPKTMTFKTYYSETPDVQSQCGYELDKEFKITKVIPGKDTGICDQVGTGNPESILKVQAGVQFPIDMLMECCRSKACEDEVTAMVVQPAPGTMPADKTTGQGNATE
jgi:hypothetical protein